MQKQGRKGGKMRLFKFCSPTICCNYFSYMVPYVVISRQKSVVSRRSCALRKRVRADGTSARYLEIGNDERVSLCLSSNFVEKDSVILDIYGKKKKVEAVHDCRQLAKARCESTSESTI